MSDPDGSEDIKSWEVWSNINGLLHNSLDPRKDNYTINFSRSNLSVGTHTITFTVTDNNGGVFQKEMALVVTPSIIIQYSGFTFLVGIIALCALINTWPRIKQVREWWRKRKMEKMYRELDRL